MVREVGSLSPLILWQYSFTENVFILNWSFSKVVAEHPNPRKLSLVIDEYLAFASFENVQMEVRV